MIRLENLEDKKKNLMHLFKISVYYVIILKKIMRIEESEKIGYIILIMNIMYSSLLIIYYIYKPKKNLIAKKLKDILEIYYLPKIMKP